MKKVYLVYCYFGDGVDGVVKVFSKKENAKNDVAERNKLFFEEDEYFWYEELEVADYSETIQNDGKF